MPAIVSDSFTGTANTSINGRVAGGAAWSVAGAVNGLQINAANQLKAVSASSGSLARIELGQADHYARVTALVTSSTGGCGAAVRAVDNLNFIALRLVSLSEIRLFKRIGTSTDVTVAALTGLSLTLPVVLELRISGQVVTPFANGVQLGAPEGYTVADAVFAGVTRAGIWGRGTNWDPLGDEFEGGTMDAAAVDLVPAGAAHAHRAGQAALSSGLTLTPARAVHALRGAAAALSVTDGLAPARGVHAHRGAQTALTPRLAPGGARHALRGMQAVIAEAGALPAAGSRIGWRGGEALLTPGMPPGVGLVVSVAAERREVRVERS